jgi:hypothetical protein
MEKSQVEEIALEKIELSDPTIIAQALNSVNLITNQSNTAL